MPIFNYLNTHTGKTEEHFRTINRRDCAPPHLKRLFTPPRHGFIVGHDADESPEKTVPKAFQACEDKYGRREIERQTGFSKDEIRRVWSF